ncbi:hypothetical protein M758_UG104900 [Ceratodon purpureus]|nr:hypothetical protein M758_UG104900 [Ceratodon purpureus]
MSKLVGHLLHRQCNGRPLHRASMVSRFKTVHSPNRLKFFPGVFPEYMLLQVDVACLHAIDCVLQLRCSELFQAVVVRGHIDVDQNLQNGHVVNCFLPPVLLCERAPLTSDNPPCLIGCDLLGNPLLWLPWRMPFPLGFYLSQEPPHSPSSCTWRRRRWRWWSECLRRVPRGHWCLRLSIPDVP